MKSSLIPFALLACLLAPAALAEDERDGSSQLPPVASRTNPAVSRTDVVRQESLELPGLTACHQCEWRPKPNQMAAAEQCGNAADGTAMVGLFECGFSQDCERVCNFVECLK